MNIRFQQRLFSMAQRVALFHVVAFFFSVARPAPRVFAAGTKEPAVIARTQPADPGSQHTSVVRSGSMETKEGLASRPDSHLRSRQSIPPQSRAPPLLPHPHH